MGVVIEREEWALTPLAYPLLSAASLAAVLLLPCFSPLQTTSAAAILILLSVRLVEGIQSVFGEDEFTRCGLGREQMASCLAASAAAMFFLGGVSGVVSDKLITEGLHILLDTSACSGSHEDFQRASLCLD